MNDPIIIILHKSLNDTVLTDVEQKKLDHWTGRSEHNLNLYDEIMNSEKFRQDIKKMLKYDGKSIWHKISKELYPSRYKSSTFFQNFFLSWRLRYWFVLPPLFIYCL